MVLDFWQRLSLYSSAVNKRMTERKPASRGTGGFTLIEVIIAAAIFSIGILGFLQSFTYIAKAVHVTRYKTIAANLVQAQVEVLKNNSYYALQVTTVTVTDSRFTPSITYSGGAYSISTVTVAGIPFYVASRVDFAALVNNSVTLFNYTDPDPGMKQITTYVLWKDGTVWKYIYLTNLLENPNVTPLTATITGVVKDTSSVVIPNIAVKTMENPSLQGLTNASGVYSFKVNAGTYTLSCTSTAYYGQYAQSQVVSAGTTLTQNFTMFRIASGTVAGYAWTPPSGVGHYLISQVVASTVTWVPDMGQTEDIEYVELVNPTTSTVDMSYIVLYVYRHNGGNDSPLKYNYTYGYPWIPDPTWDYMSYRSTYIPPNSYFLIANTSLTFVLNNSTIAADAWVEQYWQWDGNSWSNQTGPFPNMIRSSQESSSPQSVMVYSYDPNWTNFFEDYVGFTGSSGKYPYLYKSDYPRCNGIDQGGQLVRLSSPGWTSSSVLRTYDTENNRFDFDCNYNTSIQSTMTVRTFNLAAGTQTAISGQPAYGAMVSVDDAFSTSTTAWQTSFTTAAGGLAYPVAKFTLNGVSTGTWDVDVASANFYTIISSVSVTSMNQTVYMPSTQTTGMAYTFQGTKGLYPGPYPAPLVTSGSLAAGTYYYRITAISSAAVGAIEDYGGAEMVTPISSGYQHMTWAPVTGAGSYRVYRGTYTGGETVYFSTNSASYTDTGGAGTSGSPPRVPANGHTVLTSTGAWGYVNGYVWDISGVPLSGIAVNVGGIPYTTNAQGYYYSAVSTGPCTVIINSGNANSAYVSDTFNLTITQGVVTNQNDYLLRGGTLKGFATSGVSALPNMNFVALLGGQTQLGDGTSDTSGYFYIYNLTTGTYTVQPALDPVATSVPTSTSVVVTQGQTIFIGTFTITGAYGTITGNVTKSGSAITTGALILASTVTIPTSPPTVVASSSAAQDLYYSVSSLSDGTYTLLVRGATNYTYNIRAFYPTLNGQTVTTSNVSYTGLNVTPGGTVTQNVSFP